MSKMCLIKKIKIVIFLSFLFISTSKIYADRNNAQCIIRIGLIRNVNSVSINGQTILSGEVSEDKIIFKGGGNNWIKVNGRPYRGDIEIKRNDNGSLTVINILDIEKYLYGVIKEEISPRWHKEAVKAQIIAARTFALKNLGKYKDEGFDLSNTVQSQVYGGVNSEDKISNKYVDETRGEVITYRGELINAVYHGICGGYTEDARNVWGGSKRIPYLTSVSCNWCKGAPGFNWKREISLDTIQSALENGGIKVGKIENIRVTRKSRTGRAMQIKIFGSRGSETIQGNKFRLLLGADVVRSTLFDVTKRGKNIVFSGKGWGHGVGMCQEGIRGMANKGYKYTEIIRYYYRGTRVEKWRGKDR